MKKRLILLGTVIALSVTSCKENLPTEQFAKENIEEVIKLESDDEIKLIDFKKNDGLREEANGVSYYSIDFEGKISFIKDGFYYNKAYDSEKGFLRFEEKKPNYESYYYEEVTKGTEKNIKGVIHFIKKENGWTRNGSKMFLINENK